MRVRIDTIKIGAVSFFLLSSLLCSTALAQQQRVNGTVTDAQTGNPLVGVNILVQGTTTGTITDANGHYSLSVPSLSDTLRFSFVGYQTKMIPIDGRTTIDVSLQPEAIVGQELVVVGYGTQREEFLTGSISKIDPSVSRNIAHANVFEGLKGRVSGLHVGLTNSAGESPTLQMRGYNTLSTSAAVNKPLIVLDGSIYRGSIQDLNPSVIESINILKGISATAVYGSQGSNGVIIVTTKEGPNLKSEPVFSYSAKLTRMVPNEHALEPMNREQWLKFQKDVHWLQSRIPPDYLEENPNYSPLSFLRTANVIKGFKNSIYHNWYDDFTSPGYMMNHNLSVSGGSENMGYFISGGYTREKGYRKNDKYIRYNLRVNLNFDLSKSIHLETKSFLASSSYPGINIGNTFLIPPIARAKNKQGEYVLNAAIRAEPNPYLRLQGTNSDKRLQIRGNAHLRINLPFIKGLTYVAKFSYAYRTVNHDFFMPPLGAQFTGNGFKNHSRHYAWTFDNLIQFNRTINGTHKINLTLLYGAEKIKDESTVAHAYNFNSDKLGYNSLELGDPGLNDILTGAEAETSIYQMARLNYTYNSKYLFTGTIRRDGYSGFGKDKFGIFPSVAVGWIISNEPFLKHNVEWLNFLKLRASYGSAGRRAVGRYQTLARVNRGIDYVFGNGGTPVLGQYVTSMANPSLTWETTTGINIGMNFGLFKGRLRGSFSYYNTNTHDILYSIQIPHITGFGSIPKNISKVHNYGFEFSLTGKIFRSNNFNWQATFSFSRDRNEIKKILGTGSLVASRLFVGQPQRVNYDYKIIGMWQLDDENIPRGFFPGTYKLADLNDDGKISAEKDKKVLNYKGPGYRLSLSNTINYKNWSFSFLIYSIRGGENYYYGDPSPYVSETWGKLDQLEYSNVPKGAWDYWMPENPDATYRRLDAFSAYADNGSEGGAHPYMEKDFIRLRSVSLGYHFNQSLLTKLGISNLRLYVSAKNLFTFTDWPGWEPETATGFAPYGRPTMRSFTIGLNIEF